MHLFRLKSPIFRLLPSAASFKTQLRLIIVATLIGVMLVAANGLGYPKQTPPIGKISMKAVSWKLVKELAEPDAGLTRHRVTVVNPADQTVIASGVTDRSGLVEFEIPEGTYTLLGAGDEPQKVRVQAGQTAKFKLIVH